MVLLKVCPIISKFKLLTLGLNAQGGNGSPSLIGSSFHPASSREPLGAGIKHIAHVGCGYKGQKAARGHVNHLPAAAVPGRGMAGWRQECCIRGYLGSFMPRLWGPQSYCRMQERRGKCAVAASGSLSQRTFLFGSFIYFQIFLVLYFIRKQWIVFK